MRILRCGEYFSECGDIHLTALAAGEDVSLYSYHPDDLAVKQRSEFKESRAELVAAITVTTVAGNTFDGDEQSQERMARSITALDDGETVLWVLHDNSVIDASRDELREALRLAGSAQAALWVQG
jgi:hypothetical protein